MCPLTLTYITCSQYVIYWNSIVRMSNIICSTHEFSQNHIGKQNWFRKLEEARFRFQMFSSSVFVISRWFQINGATSIATFEILLVLKYHAAHDGVATECFSFQITLNILVSNEIEVVRHSYSVNYFVFHGILAFPYFIGKRVCVYRWTTNR